MEKTGWILGYRRGPSSQDPNHVLLKIDGVNDYREASRFIGAKIVLRDRHGNMFIGRITRVHGRKGIVQAVFKPNIPGQVIGMPVKIILPK